jgi:hypothetical protein
MDVPSATRREKASALTYGYNAAATLDQLTSNSGDYYDKCIEGVFECRRGARGGGA